MQEKFLRFRREYPEFHYNNYYLEKQGGDILIRYEFAIPGLCRFSPEIRIPAERLPLCNAWDSPIAKRIVFSLGMVEALSYWKCACPPLLRVNCGVLTVEEILWWKNLWFGGLGEFFYRNGIQTDFDSFVTVEAQGASAAVPDLTFTAQGLQLIPVGGGKDSCVTMDLLQNYRDVNWFFTVNDQSAREECVLAAGYGRERIVRSYRTIAPELLARNREGFLNGHTPFSAIVAFLSYYCAYLIGAEYIILSNEASANEGNLAGGAVNHQYSKSSRFEDDFAQYTRLHFTDKIHYFSLLRPWNELQIAKRFAALKQFHPAFKSCNVGSKQNIWCCGCAKCLFVYCILSPFLSREELQDIFGANLLEKEELLADFDGLCGFAPVKPFECVGTTSEVCAALTMTAAQTEQPELLLRRFLQQSQATGTEQAQELLRAWNENHSIPPRFTSLMKEMSRFD